MTEETVRFIFGTLLCFAVNIFIFYLIFRWK